MYLLGITNSKIYSKNCKLNNAIKKTVKNLKQKQSIKNETKN